VLIFKLSDLELDYDASIWDEHEDVFGETDTKENRRSIPEGFQWTCCNRLGDELGCQPGPHQSNPDLSAKRGKYESEADDPREDEDGEGAGERARGLLRQQRAGMVS